MVTAFAPGSTGTARVRPLPGVRFRAEPPPLPDPLPRMDIAAFVGFAARGPLHTPVPVEDLEHFHDIFGAEAPRLAWDTDAGEWAEACLPAAVHDFFSHGGRRCWVVRVAGKDATRNLFPVPGLLVAGADRGLGPAVARARAVGSWSDAVQVAAGTLVRPLRFLAAPVTFSGSPLPPAARVGLTVQNVRGAALGPGELLQIEFTGATGDGLRAFLLVEGTEEVAAVADAGLPSTGQAGLSSAAGRWLAVAGQAYWFRRLAGGDLDGTLEPDPLGAPGVAFPAHLHAAARAVAVTAGSDFRTPADNTWMVFRPADPVAAGAERLWLMAGEGAAEAVPFGDGWLEIDPASIMDASGLVPGRVARVTLELRVSDAGSGAGTLSLADLSYSDLHARFWGRLPNDEALYALVKGDPEPAEGPPWAALTAEATNPRFPLAGPTEVGEVYLPLGALSATSWAGAAVQAAGPLVRDGLVPTGIDGALIGGANWAAFLQEVYLDPWLAEVGQASLLAEAFDRRFIQRIALQGLHSLVGIEEISMVALPDAGQRGWRLVSQLAPAPPEEEPPPPPPPACPGHDVFQPMESAPVDEEPGPPMAAPATAQDAAHGERWELLPTIEYDATGLLLVQRAATWMSAARADMLAVLGLPQHFRPRDVLVYREQLGRELAYPDATASYAALYYPWLISREPEGRPAGQTKLTGTPGTAAGSLPLGAARPQPAASQQRLGLRRAGPEGAACGIIAERGMARGAWVAPANEQVRDAVALESRFTPAEQLDLYNSGVNLIVREPRGFLLMGADTLSMDDDFLSLGVRRLLIVLRRLALREGQTYVFAPHSPAFRRRVALGFERWLAGMFTRGAFAGDDPASAYRVVVDETVNTQASVEQGRFIVELRVAPSQPLTFITVRLVQTEPETLTVQEV